MIQVQAIMILSSYLLGAIPFGYILTQKRTGLNILKEGSGNIGSTNVRRVAGKRIAFQVQILDMMKGLIPVSVVLLCNKSGLFDFPDYFIFLVAFCTILGHNFSVFLRFRGGKGVNTTLGASLLVAPIHVLCAVGVYCLVKKILKYTSAGSIALALTLLASGLILQSGEWLLIYLAFCCLMILLRHIPNLRRLFSGEEIL